MSWDKKTSYKALSLVAVLVAFSFIVGGFNNITGNVVNATSASISVSVPTQNQAITTSSMNAQFFAANAPTGSKINISLNYGRAIQVPSSTRSYQLTGLTNGYQYITVELVDSQGRSLNPRLIVTRQFRVNLPAPSITLISPTQNQIINSRDLSLQLQAYSYPTGAWINVYLDNNFVDRFGASVTNTQRNALKGLSLGNHSIRLKLTYANGTIIASSNEIKFVISSSVYVSTISNGYKISNALTTQPNYLSFQATIRPSTVNPGWQAIVEQGSGSAIGWHLYQNGKKLYVNFDNSKNSFFTGDVMLSANTPYIVNFTKIGNNVTVYVNGQRVGNRIISNMSLVGDGVYLGIRKRGNQFPYKGQILSADLSLNTNLVEITYKPVITSATRSGNRVSLYWSFSKPGSNYYYLYRSTTNIISGSPLNPTAVFSTTYNDTNAPATNRYYYWVKANGQDSEISVSRCVPGTGAGQNC